jgi:predicted TIM-barrel fold metal-dependent hydrolase
MPSVPIIDSHVHLWDPTHLRIPHLDGNEVIGKPFLLEDYRAHTAGLEIEGIVYLEVDAAPSQTLLEAKWVADLPNDGPPILGIVPWAPVEYGDLARAYLDALVAIDPRIKGVRRLYQAEPDVDFCIQPDFIRGVQILAEYGLSFDLGVRQLQLRNTITLVRACPNVQFVLDHIGKPNIKEGVLDPWRDEIRELASFPNVFCKLSGMTTEADWQHWTVDDLRPFAERVLAEFGEDRVMYGGDWPVSLLATPYRRWAETVESLTAGHSPEAQRKLWNENARRFYRVDRSQESVVRRQ